MICLLDPAGRYRHSSMPPTGSSRRAAPISRRCSWPFLSWASACGTPSVARRRLPVVAGLLYLVYNYAIFAFAVAMNRLTRFTSNFGLPAACACGARSRRRVYGVSELLNRRAQAVCRFGRRRRRPRRACAGPRQALPSSCHFALSPDRLAARAALRVSDAHLGRASWGAAHRRLPPTALSGDEDRGPRGRRYRRPDRLAVFVAAHFAMGSSTRSRAARGPLLFPFATNAASRWVFEARGDAWAACPGDDPDSLRSPS